MKRSLWLALSLGLVLVMALVAQSCTRPRPTPVAAGQDPNPGATLTMAISSPTGADAAAPSVEEKTPTLTEPTPTLTPETVVVVTEAPTQVPATETPVPPTQVVATEAPAPPKSAAAARGEFTYEVRWGDTLSGIASRFGTTTAAIMARNPRITNSHQIFAGWGLIIPAGSTPTGGTISKPQETGEYVVQRGDTLTGIARRFGTTVAELLRANPWITNKNYVQAGRHLVIPAGGDWTPNGQTHVVRAGEALTSIARRYNTTVWALVVRNNLASANYIYAGQVLVIP